MSCIFCHSLDSSHSEEPAASVVDSMEESSDKCWDSNSDVSVSDTDSVYVPTPERPVSIKVSRTDLPNEVEVSQLDKFVESINKVRRCVTPHCVGELIPLKF